MFKLKTQPTKSMFFSEVYDIYKYVKEKEAAIHKQIRKVCIEILVPQNHLPFCLHTSVITL